MGGFAAGRIRIGALRPSFRTHPRVPVLANGMEVENLLVVMKTVFQKIIDGEIPARKEHQDEWCIAIRDLNPQAPVHLLIIPKKPLKRLGEAGAEDQALLGHLLLTASKLATEMNLSKGYRVVINNGVDGGESVQHLHVHLLGGRSLGWPPG